MSIFTNIDTCRLWEMKYWDGIGATLQPFWFCIYTKTGVLHWRICSKLKVCYLYVMLSLEHASNISGATA